jgi:acyl-CoA synthetase (NDP forming)
VLGSAEIDLLVVVVGSSAEFFPEQSIKPIADAAHAAGAGAPPLAVFIVPHADHALTILAKAGIAAFRTSESCAEAIRAYLHAQVPMPQGKPMLPNLAMTIIQKKGRRWNERDALELFAAMGIPCVRQTILSVADAMEGRRLGEMPGFPLVAKLLSSGLPHKTEAGAVTLGIRNTDELKTAVSRMMQSAQAYAPHARIEGVILQEQRTALVEAILGFRKDAAVGAVITLGFGGIFTEIYRDISLRRPPITRDQARAMIDEVKGFALLRGFRGQLQGDIDALANVIVRFSQIAADDRLSEAEINPLLVCLDGSGVVAVDGLVLLRD